MTSYATKAAAKLGAKRKNLDLDTLAFVQNNESRWVWEVLAEPVIGIFNFCPDCNIDLTNGVRDNKDDWNEFLNGHLHISGQEKADYIQQMTSVQNQYHCLGCGSNFGPAVKLEMPVTPAKSESTGLTIERDREMQNGITRPSSGTVCASIWDACDHFLADTGRAPKPKEIKNIGAVSGWNPYTCTTQLYVWRDFKGII